MILKANQLFAKGITNLVGNNHISRLSVFRNLSRSFVLFNWGNKDEKKHPENANLSTNTAGVTSIGSFDSAPKVPSLPILAHLARPIIPGYSQPYFVKHKDIINKLETNVGKGNAYVGVFMRKPGKSYNKDYPELITDKDEIFEMGSMCQIIDMKRNGDELSLFITAHRRIKLTETIAVGPPMMSEVEHIINPEITLDKTTIVAYTNEILENVREILSSSPFLRDSVGLFGMKVDSSDPYKLSDFAGGMSTQGTITQQKLLEAINVDERLKKALEVLKEELEVVNVQKNIKNQVEEKISKEQRKFFLNEELKNIKKELGIEKDDRETIVNKFKERLSNITKNGGCIPEETEKTIEEEMDKLNTMEKNSSEYNIIRNYLDWLTSIAWGCYSHDNLDIKSVTEILNEDHYGLKDVKDRILEFIAVGKLRGSVNGKIICLVGPPGVGKTSISRSIARALGREFYRFSVGGLDDISEIKGHRKTYVGAMPGKVIQCLKKSKSINPVILIDEIDKIIQGGSHRGDPSSALLEVLDPNQNEQFVDYYLDVPVDLSKVLFMCTANDLSTFPLPLLDRMEIIRIPGYDLKEKIEISKRYLVPKKTLECGLRAESDRKDKIIISDETLQQLAEYYCREAGVRNLEKHIEKICRKIALKECLNPSNSHVEVVNLDMLEELVGKPIFPNKTMYMENTPIGVVMGLAWTSLGGTSLYIECQSIPNYKLVKDSKDGGEKEENISGFKITGQLGDVMKESANIAYSLSKVILYQIYEDSKINKDKYKSYNINPNYFNNHFIHLHVPEGATPKDGPSAGVTLTTSMLSLALNIPVRKGLCMTGEISLTGKVLPVGGIKEKSMAAARAGMVDVVIPKDNERDYEDVSDHVKEKVRFHYASTYKDVFKLAFPDFPLANNVLANIN